MKCWEIAALDKKRRIYHYHLFMSKSDKKLPIYSGVHNDHGAENGVINQLRISFRPS